MQGDIKFKAFDSRRELFADYSSKFESFIKAKSVTYKKITQVFLTNQTLEIYKLLKTAMRQREITNVDNLDVENIVAHRKEAFDPKRFAISERFKFWTHMNCW